MKLDKYEKKWLLREAKMTPKAIHAFCGIFGAAAYDEAFCCLGIRLRENNLALYRKARSSFTGRYGFPPSRDFLELALLSGRPIFESSIKEALR